MLTVNDLTEVLGLSEHQVRRRINALGDVIEGYLERGKKGRLEVNSSGLELLKRLEGLHKDGNTISEAVDIIREETKDNTNTKDVNRSPNQANPELITELRDRINELQEDKRQLRSQLERKDEQLQKFLSGEVERKSPLTRFFNWIRPT